MFFIPTLRVVFLDVFRLRLVGVNNMPSPVPQHLTMSFTLFRRIKFRWTSVPRRINYTLSLLFATKLCRPSFVLDFSHFLGTECNSIVFFRKPSREQTFWRYSSGITDSIFRVCLFGSL